MISCLINRNAGSGAVVPGWDELGRGLVVISEIVGIQPEDITPAVTP